MKNFNLLISLSISLVLFSCTTMKNLKIDSEIALIDKQQKNEERGRLDLNESLEKMSYNLTALSVERAYRDRLFRVVNELMTLVHKYDRLNGEVSDLRLEKVDVESLSFNELKGLQQALLSYADTLLELNKKRLSTKKILFRSKRNALESKKRLNELSSCFP